MSTQPPPKRLDGSKPTSKQAGAESKPSFKQTMKTKGSVWGKAALDKGTHISDVVGGKINMYAEKMGSEPFWPVTGDFASEMDKAARILRAFTVTGIEGLSDPSAKAESSKTKHKELVTIPPAVIAQAKGLVIFTSMRMGMAPFGGAGGSGVVVAKLPDGTWSAPSSISPNNVTAGFMIGADIYDAVLVIRSDKALQSFSTHKVTLGTDIAVVAGPVGAGAAYEVGIDKAPVFSYVRSRGMYAGIQAVGQVFVERFDENAAMYAWPGVKAGDILAGKVRVPAEAASLQHALRDAERGRATNPSTPSMAPHHAQDIRRHEIESEGNGNSTSVEPQSAGKSYDSENPTHEENPEELPSYQSVTAEDSSAVTIQEKETIQREGGSSESSGREDFPNEKC